MPRFHLDIEYDGSAFVGWQRQTNGRSVQEALEEAGAALSQDKAPVYGAGRTDAGVHALAMGAHIDLARPFPAHTVRDGLNAYLRNEPVSVLTARAVPSSFHARFSCHTRHYRYRVLVRRSPPALDQQRVWRISGPLAIDQMAEAARFLVGRFDFTTFRSVHCQADDPFRTLPQCDVVSRDQEVHFVLSAPSFLHNQVRSIVGTLVQVGLGRWAPEDVAAALAATDRSRCGPVAPPFGLYFVRADYPPT